MVNKDVYNLSLVRIGGCFVYELYSRVIVLLNCDLYALCV